MAATGALFILLTFIGPLRVQDGDLQPELVESNRALYRGDFDRAAVLARSYLKAHPRTAAARILLARAEMAQGKMSPSYEELQKVLGAEPANIDALYYLGRLSAILSQLEFQQLYALAPDSARVHQLLAESYATQQDTQKAKEEYRAALEASPHSVEVLDALGDLERFGFRFDEALSYYARAAEIKPRDYTSAYGMGACYLYKQDPQRAIEHLRRAVALDPESAAAHLALGDALLRAGQPREAVEEFKAAARFESGMRQAYTLLARAYQKLGQSQEAETALKKAQELTRKESESLENQLGSDELAPPSARPRDEALAPPRPKD